MYMYTYVYRNSLIEIEDLTKTHYRESMIMKDRSEKMRFWSSQFGKAMVIDW